MEPRFWSIGDTSENVYVSVVVYDRMTHLSPMLHNRVEGLVAPDFVN